MSFEAYWVDRRDRPAIEFEGTFSNEYVVDFLTTAASDGYLLEPVLGDEPTFGRVVFVRADDGRPWIYREFYPVGVPRD